MFVARTCDLPLSDYPDDFPVALRRVLSARRIGFDALKKPLSALIHDQELPNADKAAKRLADAIKHGERIVVVGDYDADGATATALMMQFLTALDADVHFAIPNRQLHGYGLSTHFLTEAVLPLAPKLIVTVDNGIKSHDAIALAKSHDIVVIITDHHLPDTNNIEACEHLPDADVIVNPNISPTAKGLTNLAGVGVAFYVLLALRRALSEQKHAAIGDINMGDLLDLVAIGTMADCVSLDYNNRILVAAGLARMRAGRSSLGVQALMRTLEKQAQKLSATDIAFYLAPMLNAAGRLGDMRVGIECLLATSERMANDYALHLLELNRQRKTLENQSRVEAEYVLNALTDVDASSRGICVFDETWHEGVIGIVASRLVERYQQPAVVFAQGAGAQTGLLKGSGRSVDDLNLVALFAELANELPDAVSQFGGHATAAGISVPIEQFDAFQRAFHAKTQRSSVIKRTAHDGELVAEELSLGFAETLSQFEIWGHGNPEPVFVNTFAVKSVRLVGDIHAKCQLIELGSQQVIDAIAFSQFEAWRELTGSQQKVAYRLGVNEWRGVKKLQLMIERVMPAKDALNTQPMQGIAQNHQPSLLQVDQAPRS